MKTKAPKGKQARGSSKQRSKTFGKKDEVSRKAQTTNAQYGEMKRIKARAPKRRARAKTTLQPR